MEIPFRFLLPVPSDSVCLSLRGWAGGLKNSHVSFFDYLSIVMIPEFLVIGAQKAGTTWLDRNLRSHPGIWLPPEKEVHFFNLPPLLPFFFLLFAPMRPVRYWAGNRMLGDFRKVIAREYRLRWYVRCYFFLRTQRWYFSLFKPSAGQAAGEITPRYAILTETEIARVHALMPDAKIIYLLRDPLERLWSDLAMFHRPKYGSQGLENAGEKSIRQFIGNSTHQASSRYVSNLRRWEKYYPPEQIFVGFQEQIRDNPEQLLKDICHFLGVATPDDHVFSRARQLIHSHEYPAMPPTLAHTLASLFINDIEQLHQRFNNEYTAKWLLSARQFMGNGG